MVKIIENQDLKLKNNITEHVFSKKYSFLIQVKNNILFITLNIFITYSESVSFGGLAIQLYDF